MANGIGQFTKGIPSIPDVTPRLTEDDLYRILEPIKRIMDIRQGQFDPLDRWVTQQDLINAGLQTNETVVSPVIIESPVSEYPFQLIGDIAGNTILGTGNPTNMNTAINLPNVVVIDGGDSTSTFPGEVTGPYGVVEFSLESRDEGVQTVADTKILDFVGTGVTATAPTTNQLRVTIPGLEVEDDGTPVTTNALTLNFAGAGVVVTEPVTDEITVTIAGGGGGGSNITNLGETSMASGNTFDNTGWPDNVEWFRVYFWDVNQGNSARDITLRLYDSALVTTGYDSHCVETDVGSATYVQPTVSASTIQFALNSPDSTTLTRGYFHGQRLSSTTDRWAVTGHFYDETNDKVYKTWGEVDLGSDLDGLRIQSANVTNFTAGNFSIHYGT